MEKVYLYGIAIKNIIKSIKIVEEKEKELIILEKNNYYKGKWFNNAQYGKGKLHIDGRSISVLFRFGKLIKKNKLISQHLSSN